MLSILVLVQTQSVILMAQWVGVKTTTPSLSLRQTDQIAEVSAQDSVLKRAWI